MPDVDQLRLMVSLGLAVLEFEMSATPVVTAGLPTLSVAIWLREPPLSLVQVNT